jgi:hypothetical protein
MPTITKAPPPAPADTAPDEVADDADPTYTHFAHREQVASLLQLVLSDGPEDEEQLAAYGQIESIVSLTVRAQLTLA